MAFGLKEMSSAVGLIAVSATRPLKRGACAAPTATEQIDQDTLADSEERSPQESRKARTMLLINVVKLLSGLTPDAQILGIECLFTLMFVALLIVAFSPTGAARISHFIDQLHWLLSGTQNRPSRRAKRQHAVRAHTQQHKEGTHERTK